MSVYNTPRVEISQAVVNVTHVDMYRVRHKSCNMAVFHAIYHVQLLAEQNKKHARAAQNVPVYIEWPNFV